MAIKKSDWIVLASSTSFCIFLFLMVDFFYSKQINKRQLVGRTEKAGISFQYENGFYDLNKSVSTKGSWGKNVGFDVFINNFGFRDKGLKANYSKNNPASILFLGDSFTWGGIGGWEDGYVYKVIKETGMNSINGGVFSWSPTPYLYQYKKVANSNLLKKNGLIVLAVDISDVKGEASIWTDDDRKPYPAMLNHKTDSISNLNSPFKNISLIFKKIINIPPKLNNLTCGTRFNLTAFVRKGLGTCPSSPEIQNSYRKIINLDISAFTWKSSDKLSNSFKPLGVKEGLEKVKRKSLEIGLEAKKNSHSVLLVSYPWPAQIALEQKEINWTNFLKEICIDMKNTCIGVADVTDSFLKKSKNNQSWYKTYYVNGDVHLNSKGNQVMSNIISPYVIEYFDKKNKL